MAAAAGRDEARDDAMMEDLDTQTGIEPFTVHRLVSLENNEITTNGVRFTTITYTGRDVFVGTNKGEVRRYHLEDTRGQESAEFRAADNKHEKAVKRMIVKGKKIDQLQAVYELGIVLCLVDGKIFILRINTLEILPGTICEKVSFVEFCMHIGPNQRHTTSFTALDKKRTKLHLYQLDQEAPKNSGKFNCVYVFSVPEVANTLAHAHWLVCVGFSKTYSLIDERYSRPKELPVRIERGNPYVFVVPANPLATGETINAYESVDTAIKFFQEYGMGESTAQLEWLIGKTKGLGGFYSLQGSASERTDVPWDHKPNRLAYKFPYLIGCGKVKNEAKIEIFLHRKCQKIQTISGDQLDDKGVISICDGWPWQSCQPRGKNLVFVATEHSVFLLQHRPVDLQVESLLYESQVSDAYHLYLGTRDSPESLKEDMQRFHRAAAKARLLCAGDRKVKYEACIAHLKLIHAEVQELLQFFPSLHSNHLKSPLGDFYPKVFDSATLDILRSCKPPDNVHEAVKMKEPIGKGEGVTATIDLRDVLALATGKNRDDREIREEYAVAMRRLIDWLKEYRQSLKLSRDDMKLLQIGKLDHNTSVAQIVDTALMKGYVHLLRSKMNDLKTLVSQPTTIHIDDAHETLKSNKLYEVLGSFLVSTGHQEEALSFWKDVVDRGETDFEGDPVSESIDILRSSDDEDTIFKHCHWVFVKDFEKGLNRALEIFTKPKGRTQEVVPDRVLTFLKNEISERIPSRKLIQAYLEYLVFQLGKQEERFHTELALIYIGELKHLVEDGLSNTYDSVKRKLKEHLEMSTIYNAQSVLNELESFKEIDLTEEIVLVLGNLRRHSEALRLLIDRKQDHEGAEQYCWKHRNSNESSDSDPFSSLIDIYFKNFSDSKVNQDEHLDRGVKVFEKYLEFFNVAKCVEKIPKNAPVHRVKHLLHVVLPKKMHQRRQTQIAHALASFERLKANCGVALSKQEFAKEKAKMEGRSDYYSPISDYG